MIDVPFFTIAICVHTLVNDIPGLENTSYQPDQLPYPKLIVVLSAPNLYPPYPPFPFQNLFTTARSPQLPITFIRASMVIFPVVFMLDPFPAAI